jgi:hypothetical protein
MAYHVWLLTATVNMRSGCSGRGRDKNGSWSRIAGERNELVADEAACYDLKAKGNTKEREHGG